MRPLPLVTTLGGLALLGLAGCGDDRSASRDDTWRDWPTSYPASDQPDVGAGAAGGGSSAGYQPATGPVDTGSIPSNAPQSGGEERSGGRQDYRWDTSSENAPIGSSPGISGANYGGSTVIQDNGTSFSPRNPVIVGGSGGRGSVAGTQPGVGTNPTPPRQGGAVSPGTFGMSPPERPNVGGTGTVAPNFGSGTSVAVSPLDTTGGTGIAVSPGTGTSVTGSPLTNTTGGISTTAGSGTSTTSGTGGFTTTPGTGTSVGGGGPSGGITTGAPGAGTSIMANPLSGSGTTPEQGAIANPGTASGQADPSAAGAIATPGSAAAGTSGGTSGTSGAGSMGSGAAGGASGATSGGGGASAGGGAAGGGGASGGGAGGGAGAGGG